LITLFGLAFVPATNAIASPYTANGVTVSNSSPSPGETVTVTAGGFQPGSEASITILSDPILLATPTADANGQVSADVAIPADFAEGSRHTIEVSGIAPDGSPYSTSIEITLAGGLAQTGAEAAGLIAAAVVLVGLGAAIVVLSRRRTRAQA
jgi:LPXTG-motif cell wall-anchored protein